MIESEGNRDRMIKESEGDAQQTLSRARGQAQAIINAADAESRSIKEISKAVARHGEDPLRYLLTLKYIETLKAISCKANTTVSSIFFPI